MRGIQIRLLRSRLKLSRPELARFLGVSEATTVRWEAESGVTAPKGLPALLLHALAELEQHYTSEEIAAIVRSSSVNHRASLKRLLDAVEEGRPLSSGVRAPGEPSPDALKVGREG